MRKILLTAVVAGVLLFGLNGSAAAGVTSFDYVMTNFFFGYNADTETVFFKSETTDFTDAAGYEAFAAQYEDQAVATEWTLNVSNVVMPPSTGVYAQPELPQEMTFVFTFHAAPIYGEVVNPISMDMTYQAAGDLYEAEFVSEGIIECFSTTDVDFIQGGGFNEVGSFVLLADAAGRVDYINCPLPAPVLLLLSALVGAAVAARKM